MHEDLDGAHAGEVAAVDLGRAAVGAAREVLHVVVAPVAELHGATLALAGVRVGGDDGLVLLRPRADVLHGLAAQQAYSEILYTGSLFTSKNIGGALIFTTKVVFSVYKNHRTHTSQRFKEKTIIFTFSLQ